jgi:predicted flap endonuclease-1-like 5' DNA nuclease
LTPVPSKKTYEELHALLAEPTPKELIKHKTQGGARIPFVNITAAHDLLDARVGVGNWSVEILSGHQIGSQYVMHVRAWIYASNGDFKQDATGFEETDLDKFGDTSSNAFAMAVKRAFEHHGLCRDLWRSDAQPARERGDDEVAGPRRPANPLARTPSDLATPKQVGMARSLAAEKGYDDLEAICYEALGLKTDEITKQAASFLIDYVKSLKAAEKGSQTEKGGAQHSQGANASQTAASEPHSGNKEASPSAKTTESEPAAPAGAMKPQQATAIDSLISRWRALREVGAGELTHLLEEVGCSKIEELTEFQAGQFIRKLSDKINHEIKEAKKAR